MNKSRVSILWDDAHVLVSETFVLMASGFTPECRPTYALGFFDFLFSSLSHLFFCCLRKINLYTCLSHTLFNFFLMSFLKHFILVSLNFMWPLNFLISSLTCFIIQFFPGSLRTTFLSSSSCLIQVPHYHIDDIF